MIAATDVTQQWRIAREHAANQASGAGGIGDARLSGLRWIWVMLSVVALGLASLILPRAITEDSPHALRVTVDGRSATLNEWLAPSEEEPMVVDFSDGSQIHVHPSSRARIAGVTPDGARVCLESGLVRASIAPSRGSHTGNGWLFAAGPLRIQARQTEFELLWDADTERCLLVISNGEAMVWYADSSTVVRAGETLTVSTFDGQFALVSGQTERVESVESTHGGMPGDPAAPLERHE